MMAALGVKEATKECDKTLEEVLRGCTQQGSKLTKYGVDASRFPV